jgi:hypothetical protein
MGFNAFSGNLLLKDLSKPSGPTPHGFTWGLVLLKDLPKTANTVWYFHAQIKIMQYEQYSQQRSK